MTTVPLLHLPHTAYNGRKTAFKESGVMTEEEILTNDLHDVAKLDHVEIWFRAPALVSSVKDLTFNIRMTPQESVEYLKRYIDGSGR